MGAGNNCPIGIFDSGVGGLSVFKEVRKYLPCESFIYFADSAHTPFGEKTSDEIFNYSKKIVDFLLERKAKLIVIACNTATAHAIRKLRKQYIIPFVGMEPAIKPAALHSKTGHIGVLATAGTLKGKHFIETRKSFAKGVQVHTQVGNGLVEVVENGQFDLPETKNLLQQYINPMLENNIDHLVLGCTHYPFLFHQIKEIIGEKNVEIIDPAEPVSIQTRNLLFSYDLEANCEILPQYEFYTTGRIEIISDIIEKIDIPKEYKVKISKIDPL